MEKHNAKLYLLLLPINEIAKQFKVFSTWSVLENRIVQLFQENKNLGYKLNAVTKINVKTHTEKYFISFSKITLLFTCFGLCVMLWMGSSMFLMLQCLFVVYQGKWKTTVVSNSMETTKTLN